MPSVSKDSYLIVQFSSNNTDYFLITGVFCRLPKGMDSVVFFYIVSIFILYSSYIRPI